MPASHSKTAVITGGAGGLGQAFARALVRQGYQVALWDLDKAGVDAAAAALNAQGHRAEGVAVDVTSAEKVALAAKFIRTALGPIDILINNAGVVVPGDFLKQDEKDWTKTMGVNIHSYLLTTQAFLPGMLEKGGTLIYVASAAGLLGVPGMAVYSASKHAVVGFAESLRQELNKSHPHKVQVTIVCPSFISTGMFDGAQPPRGTKWLTADQVATRALEAAKKGRLWVREPALVKFIPFLRTLPTKLSDRLCKITGMHRSMEGLSGRR